jgi:hypothetical protein
MIYNLCYVLCLSGDMVVLFNETFLFNYFFVFYVFNRYEYIYIYFWCNQERNCLLFYYTSHMKIVIYLFDIFI